MMLQSEPDQGCCALLNAVLVNTMIQFMLFSATCFLLIQQHLMTPVMNDLQFITFFITLF